MNSYIRLDKFFPAKLEYNKNVKTLKKIQTIAINQLESAYNR